MIEHTARARDVATTELGAADTGSVVDTDGSAGLAVVEALAEVRGVAPTELETPLWDVVDLEALDALIDDGAGDCRVTFSVDDTRVTVTEEFVHVRPAE